MKVRGCPFLHLAPSDVLLSATSAIDHATDSAIQSSLRHELKNDVTLLTVAHRLQTIMDADKIVSTAYSTLMLEQRLTRSLRRWCLMLAEL